MAPDDMAPQAWSTEMQLATKSLLRQANTKRIADALRARNAKAQVVEYVFQDFVGDQLQAPYNSFRVGDHLAREIAAGPDFPTA